MAPVRISPFQETQIIKVYLFNVSMLVICKNWQPLYLVGIALLASMLATRHGKIFQVFEIIMLPQRRLTCHGAAEMYVGYQFLSQFLKTQHANELTPFPYLRKHFSYGKTDASPACWVFRNYDKLKIPNRKNWRRYDDLASPKKLHLGNGSVCGFFILS